MYLCSVNRKLETVADDLERSKKVRDVTDTSKRIHYHSSDSKSLLLIKLGFGATGRRLRTTWAAIDRRGRIRFLPEESE